MNRLQNSSSSFKGISSRKILLVFGTRPEAIKMAPLVKEFQKYPEQFDTKVCVTAQHREMLDQVLQIFEITPDYDLNIMKSGQDLFDVTSRVLLGMRDVLRRAKPDLVLVHGDTSTSTAAALAAYYEKIKVGHVEAGLRTYNIYSPFPEEMNRHITGCIATYHFAPTTISKNNLLHEGIKAKNIFVTGNTVIDALNLVLDKIKNNAGLSDTIFQEFVEAKLPKERIESWLIESNFVKIKSNSSQGRKLVLITGHRRENFGQGFVNICEAILELSILFPNVDYVYPMHLNPNVRIAIKQVFGDILKGQDILTSKNIESNPCHDNVYFIEPLQYLQFVTLMNLSYLLLTDSGGIQEEAPGLHKPVLVMRDTTERPEALEAGTVQLVGTDKQRIIDAVSRLILNSNSYEVMTQASNPYGDGKACSRIIEALNTTKKE